MKNYWAKFGLLMFVVAYIIGCGPNAEEKKVQEFITKHVDKIAPKMKEANLAYWSAANGKPEDFKKYAELDLEIRKIQSNPQEFALLKEFKSNEQIKDPVLKRQVDLLYNQYLENQIDSVLMKKIVDLGTKVETDFTGFRGEIKGKKITSNEIEEILKEETDSRKRRDTWYASKQVGEKVSDDIIKLVKLRNEAAKLLGFDNYHTMYLSMNEQNVSELDQIFDELYELTNEPFKQIKAELDSILADMYGVGIEGLMPWHYHDPFFQETPLVYELDLDIYYKDKDVKELAVQFYDGINMPVESIINNSDLYEREGKNPHAFCADIDREGDVRILCNLKNNERWMETMLHELGHAVYDKYQDSKAPFLLRQPAHIFTTEAIAMFFGRLSRNANWMQDMLGLTDEEKNEIENMSNKYAQLKQLIFARWAMVMYSFEKELYANPDQDLNQLWWDLVEKYQFVNKPANRDKPDWAAKIHFTIAPCYYHNYLLGELLASQLHHYITTNVLKLENDKDVSYVGEKAMGDYLKKNVFNVGAVYQWNTMIVNATGEPLTSKYFVEQFVK